MSAASNVLIVEDDHEVATVLRQHLELEGYYCGVAPNGEDALTEVRHQPPDLILLDRMLPGIDGDEVIRRLKADPRTQSIPIIMLTGRGDESDELVSLALGADDYVSKPFSFKRLTARIAAHLRRGRGLDKDAHVPPAHSVKLDQAHAKVLVDQTAVALAPGEYKILAALITARGHILSQRQLETVLRNGQAGASGPADITGQVETLRRKMGPAAECIQTVPRAGYAYCGPPSGSVKP